MKFKDYYQMLGVARDASAQDIKKAFRKLARQHHPDVSSASGAAARMSEINEANAVLSDPERRAAYDAIGQGRQSGEAFTPPPDWDAGFEFDRQAARGMDADEFSDFFAELFGRASQRDPARAQAQAQARRQAGSAARGDDHHAKIVLDIEDAWCGAQRRITLRVPQHDAQGRLFLAERELDLKIPAGVRPGQVIRLAGQGSPAVGDGVDGGTAGDLLLEVQLRAQERWRVEGADLHAELPLAPWEAALGAVVPVPLPDGSTLKVRVPADAQSGRRLTVRGKGLPGRTPGNLELTLRVLLPSAWDPRARRLYEQMAAALPEFDARQVAAAEAESSSQPAAEARAA